MHGIIRIGLLLAGAATLSGCVEALPTIQGDAAGLSAAAMSNRPQGREADVALASLEGPPDAVRQRFEAAFARAARARGMTVTDPASARYLVRGYLSATPASGGTGTEVTFVDDIFDAADQVRRDRVTDTLTLAATGADAWALVDDRVMDSVAGRSADRLAQALATVPSASDAKAPTAAVALN